MYNQGYDTYHRGTPCLVDGKKYCDTLLEASTWVGVSSAVLSTRLKNSGLEGKCKIGSHTVELCKRRDGKSRCLKQKDDFKKIKSRKKCCKNCAFRYAIKRCAFMYCDIVNPSKSGLSCTHFQDKLQPIAYHSPTIIKTEWRR